MRLFSVFSPGPPVEPRVADRWLCCTPGCGAVWAHPAYCVSCGGTLLRPMPLEVRGQPASWSPRQRRGVAAASDLVAAARPARRLRWGYDALTLPIETSVTLEGPPGGGKSTLATLAGLGLARAGVDVLYVATEEQRRVGAVPVRDTLIDRLERCVAMIGLDRVPPSLRISDAQVPCEVEDDLRGFSGVAVLDSLTDLRPQSGWIESLMQRAALGLVLIQHWTTGRQPRGGLEPAYGADVRICVERQQARLLKTRWGPCETFDVISARVDDEIGSEGAAVVPFPGSPR